MMQFSQLELIDHLKDAALNNPLIELEPPRSVNDQQPTWVMPNSFGDPDMPSIDQWASDGQSVSLHAHLLWQANIAGLPEKDYELILALIDFIDDTGLLSMQVSEITESLAKDQSEHVSLSKRLRKALEKLQTFEPMGVGAESIQQCLLIQLQCFHHTDPDFCLAQHLLKDHFQSIGQSNLRELSVQLGVTITALKRAFGLIQRLNPHPATSFGVLSGHHIVPDVYIHPKPCSKSATWMVTLNTAHIPSLKFNQTFEQLWPHASSADKVYLRKQHNNAKALMEGLALRHHTIVRVAEILASHQQDYLRHGPSALRPLTQKEVANQLGVHVSTVSRALKDKYAQTPQGLIQLKTSCPAHCTVIKEQLEPRPLAH